MTYISELLLIALLAQTPTATMKMKLDHACENLVRNDLDGSFIERELDLGRPEVSAYMVSKMNLLPARGELASPSDVTRQLIQAHPGKTVEWLVDHYDQFSPAGLKNMADGLRHINNREGYQILFAMLQDQREIVDEYASHVSARPYYHNRICDCAYGAISWILYKQKNLPPGLPVGLSTSNSIEQRDKEIKRLTVWWSKESEVVLQKTPALSATRPSLQFKVESLMKRPVPKAGPDK